jgi:hypothetical protein
MRDQEQINYRAKSEGTRLMPGCRAVDSSDEGERAREAA